MSDSEESKEIGSHQPVDTTIDAPLGNVQMSDDQPASIEADHISPETNMSIDQTIPETEDKGAQSAPSSDNLIPPTSTTSSADADTSGYDKLEAICSAMAISHTSVDGTCHGTDSILQLLVTEDMVSVRDPRLLNSFFINFLHKLHPKVVSEVLSVLIAIVKKSVFHLELARGLLIPCINHLLRRKPSHQSKKCTIPDDGQQQDANADFSTISLMKHFLREWINLLIAHSCDVAELRTILKFSIEEPSLLSFVQQAHEKQRNRPSAFFAFPGTRGSVMSLPPFQKWPIQTGWSFSTWFYLEPKTGAQPYLYNFKTGKSGLGYSAHFTGSCLVLTSIRVKGKGVQHCVAYEFPSYKWTHCAVTYHNKWRASEIKVYVNGQLSANIEMPWQVQTTEILDKCFVGGSGLISSKERQAELNCFCGQMSAIYLFNEGLTANQICAIHRLGSSYMGQFKYSNESLVNLPPQTSKVLYEDKLASSLFCLYTPAAVDSGTLCIQLAPFKSSTSASAQNYCLSAPHAALQGQAKAIITQPINSTLQSLGCSRSLLPLLDAFASKPDSEACSSLLCFLCDLLKSSPHWFANEIVQCNGFVIVACALSNNPRALLSDKILDTFLGLAGTLLTTSTSIGDSSLMKHFMDNILLNPSLWIYSEARLQVKLYSYLANEFIHGTRSSMNKYSNSNSIAANSSAPIADSGIQTNSTVPAEANNRLSIVRDVLFSEVRRVSTVLQSLHCLSHFYWIHEEHNIKPKARNYKLRPSQGDLQIIRTHILSFTKELIKRADSIPADEVQGLLNYFSTCTEAENITDVVDMLSSLLKENPIAIVSALDQKQGIRAIFSLISSPDELVRVKALRLLALLLAQCSFKKKQELMGSHNLFMLLFDKLKMYKPLSLEVYQALMDILLESDLSNSKDILQGEARNKVLCRKRIENSTVLKVIASLLHDERTTSVDPESNNIQNSTRDIRSFFINDLWNLIVCSRDNRRIILQMSVWQHWLINLIDSTISDSQLARDQVLAIFRVLLYHALRYEYGGWRVWIDTLAIIHTKVSYDHFYHQVNEDSIEPKEVRYPNESNRNPESTKVILKGTEDSTHDDKKEILKQDQDARHPAVSSISEHVVHESSGLKVNDSDIDQVEEMKVNQDESIDNLKTTQDNDECSEETREQSSVEENNVDDGLIDRKLDSVDLAPSRAYRKLSIENSNTGTPPNVEQYESEVNESVVANRRHSLTSISLDDPVNENAEITNMTEAQESADSPASSVNDKMKEVLDLGSDRTADTPPKKASASPAFRIPEFKWSSVLIKLLNDLMFSIECDLYSWRCSTNCASLDTLPFSVKSPSSSSSAGSSSNKAQNSSSSSAHIESLLQRPEIQTYIVNTIHFVSQLADNMVIASGGLLPLLAEATGGSRSTSKVIGTEHQHGVPRVEGLTLQEANSFLYRLVSIVDVVVFAAAHINLNELEADKNTTSGGILRQCLRLACTVTVKNCLLIRNLTEQRGCLFDEGYLMTEADFPRDMFDSFHGCSFLSANGLFKDSALNPETSDLIANTEFSPNQSPSTSSAPSLLPFQSVPIRDPSKLLQPIDILRIQACIYHDMNIESRQSQFLALSSLYFISVLMVSKYRDIIEPKHQKTDRIKSYETEDSLQQKREGKSAHSTNKTATPITSVESDLLTFGKLQPTTPAASNPGAATTITDILTRRLENTLNSICPLLKTIMCDFSAFLSRTLIGSHGQDLVSKEADRTFKRSNTSPVELVMLLCSQEWQNTLQKNAGLAFIELINEGRVLSHGMKDHIVRVAMEAEFILSRLRADDVAKHEHFALACSETHSARIHEEMLINSLISTAGRRDYAIYNKFKEAIKTQRRRKYKLDIWEDDDRRKRRYVVDSWDDNFQILYSHCQTSDNCSSAQSTVRQTPTSDTKRILDLQKTIEMGGIDDHCSPAGVQLSDDVEVPNSGIEIEDNDQSDEEKGATFRGEDSASANSDNESPHSNNLDASARSSKDDRIDSTKTTYPIQKVQSNKSLRDREPHDREDDGLDSTSRGDQPWESDECNSISESSSSAIFAAECSLIWSIYSIPGVFQLTSHELYFEPAQNISESIELMKKDAVIDEHQGKKQGSFGKLDLMVLRYCDFLTCNGKILLHDIRAIFSRHYLLQPHALEIFLAQRTSVMFAFNDFDTVKRAVKCLPPVGVGIKYGIPQVRKASLMTAKQLFTASNMTHKWQTREISNFQYLMFLNTIAGRTYQDLNQYPVFPWILTNYESEELDLNLPSNFRDLSKPMGALNSKRRAEFVDRYQSWDNPKIPPFHYGTHYSTAAFTLNWLCRLRGACNSAYLAIQDGKYEEESRLFLSLGDSWVSSLVGGQQNVKELIPEFFYLPEMFHSSLGLPEVELPPWAKSTEHFVRCHRMALESELVSCQLHQWIDLIFGYKQRGPEAINAVNTFYYLTYQGNVYLNMIQDPTLREAIETQIKHFGQTPSQISTEPHPPRFSALHASPLMFSPSIDEVNKVVKYPYKTSIVHIVPCVQGYSLASGPTAAEPAGSTANTNSSSSNSISSVLTLTSNNQYQIHKWSTANEQTGSPFTVDQHLERHGSGAAARRLIDVDDLCSSIKLDLGNHSRSNSCNSSALLEAKWTSAHYVATLDARYIIMGSFYDNSFRVFSTEGGKLCQVIYGHKGPITCISRSEGNSAGDFFVATGSQDCSLLLWTWNDRFAQIEGSGVSAVHNPLPKLTISGHLSSILSCVISAELGLIISGSKNLLLVHSTSSGENLLEIDVVLPNMLDKLSVNGRGPAPEGLIQRPTVTDKQRTILEASMLGDQVQPQTDSIKGKQPSDKKPRSSRSNSLSSSTSERFSYLKELGTSDYYITNLQLSRELAFIVCTALPPPKPKLTAKNSIEETPIKEPVALLMTFNLKGNLMDAITIGQAVNSPRLGDQCLLQCTRDGEHTLLNDSPTTLKIYRTFDLQPVYAYNTNDIPNTISDDQNRISSLAIVDDRHILVGLENGKIVVYNTNFKNL